MRYSTVLSTLLAASLVSAHPHQPAKRAVSPDGTCGSATGYTCPSSTPCCSQWGWCGSTADYCAAGCQPAFGTCDDGGGTPTQSPTGNPTSSPTSPPNPGDVRSVPRTKVGSVPYGSVIYSCVRNGDIALTFDDGPYIYTPTVLDVLAQYNVKATFFIVGSNGNGDIDKVAQWSSIVRRTFDEGHQIASHTWNHPDLTTLSSSARREQMYLTETAIANILDGRFPTYMRPPYLGFDAAVEADMADLGYHVVSTNLDTKDYANTSPATIGNSQRIFDDFTAQDPRSSSFIVLNHDIHSTTVEILTEYEIQRLSSRGYRAVTVGECLGDDPANWYRTVSGPAFRLFKAEVGEENAAPAETLSSEELAAEGFAPPAAACYTVDAPNSIERLMRLV